MCGVLLGSIWCCCWSGGKCRVWWWSELVNVFDVKLCCLYFVVMIMCIVIDFEVCGGWFIVVGMCMWVIDVLDVFVVGVGIDELFVDFFYLMWEDVVVCFVYVVCLFDYWVVNVV